MSWVVGVLMYLAWKRMSVRLMESIGNANVFA